MIVYVSEIQINIATVGGRGGTSKVGYKDLQNNSQWVVYTNVDPTLIADPNFKDKYL